MIKIDGVLKKEMADFQVSSVKEQNKCCIDASVTFTTTYAEADGI